MPIAVVASTYSTHSIVAVVVIAAIGYLLIRWRTNRAADTRVDSRPPGTAPPPGSGAERWERPSAVPPPGPLGEPVNEKGSEDDSGAGPSSA